MARINELIFLFISFFAVAGSAAVDNICSLQWGDFQSRLSNTDNLLAFPNSGGPMTIGLCWWHTRYQRNSDYLIQFDPSSSQNADDTAKSIHALTSSKKVVVVKGYSNLNQFSADNAEAMTETLGQWQMVDSFIKMQWFRGLRSTSINDGKLSKQMDDLYHDVGVNKNVVFQMLKMSGLEAHAWLVKNVVATETGYQLEVIDSNFPMAPYLVDYSRGESKLSSDVYGNLAPYPQHQDDLPVYKKAQAAFCKQ